MGGHAVRHDVQRLPLTAASPDLQPVFTQLRGACVNKL
jgi:hypothetical protein